MNAGSPARKSKPSLNPDVWLQEYGDLLFRQAYLIVRRKEVAEDIVQDTLLAAYKNRDSFQGKASEKTWLVSILKNKCIDHLRKFKREDIQDLSGLEDDQNDQFNSFGIWSKWLKSWDANPEEEFERKKFVNALEGCLNKLSPRLRSVMVLKTIEQRKTDQVCNDLEISPSNLWVLVHRARAQLRECMDKNWYNQ